MSLLALLLALSAAPACAAHVRIALPSMRLSSLAHPAALEAWDLTLRRGLEHGFVEIVDARGRALERGPLAAGSPGLIDLSAQHAELGELWRRDARLRAAASEWRDLHTHVPDPAGFPGFSRLDHDGQAFHRSRFDADPLLADVPFQAAVVFWDFGLGEAVVERIRHLPR